MYVCMHACMYVCMYAWDRPIFVEMLVIFGDIKPDLAGTSVTLLTWSADIDLWVSAVDPVVQGPGFYWT